METCGFLLVKNLRYHQKVLPEKLFLGGSRSTPLCSQAAYNRSNPLLCSVVGFHTTAISSGERSGVMGNTSDVSTSAVIVILYESRR